MKEKRLKSQKGKFKIDRKGSFEDNIKKLESELDVISTGAPKVYDKEEDLEKELHKAEKVVKTTKKEEPKIPPQEEVKKDVYQPPVPPVTQSNYNYNLQARKRKKSLFTNTKFYITIFAIISFGILISKAPIFQYTTPFRADNDIPELEIAFKYYNNILGKQTKQMTVIKSGMKTALIPFPMQQWVNFTLDKKQMIIKEYLLK